MKRKWKKSNFSSRALFEKAPINEELLPLDNCFSSAKVTNVVWNDVNQSTSWEQTWTICKAGTSVNPDAKAAWLLSSTKKSSLYFLVNIAKEQHPGQTFLEIHRDFSNTAGNSVDTAVNALGTTDAPLS